LFGQHLSTGWWRPIGCLKLQVTFHQRATSYRALLRKVTYKDKASYGSSPPCNFAIAAIFYNKHAFPVRKCTKIYKYVYAYVHMCISLYLCTYIWMRKSLCKCMGICVYIYVYIFTYTTHMYMYNVRIYVFVNNLHINTFP